MRSPFANHQAKANHNYCATIKSCLELYLQLNFTFCSITVHRYATDITDQQVTRQLIRRLSLKKVVKNRSSDWGIRSFGLGTVRHFFLGFNYAIWFIYKYYSVLYRRIRKKTIGYVDEGKSEFRIPRACLTFIAHAWTTDSVSGLLCINFARDSRYLSDTILVNIKVAVVRGNKGSEGNTKGQ